MEGNAAGKRHRSLSGLSKVLKALGVIKSSRAQRTIALKAINNVF